MALRNSGLPPGGAPASAVTAPAGASDSISRRVICVNHTAPHYQFTRNTTLMRLCSGATTPVTVPKAVLAGAVLGAENIA